MVRIEELGGKSVLVTGASSGIGAAVSRAFAAQGARLAIHWHANEAAAQSVASDIQAQGGTAVLLQADLSLPGTGRQLVDEAARALQGLDVLINCAGSLVSRRPFLEADDAWVDGVFNLNARAVIGTCQAAAPHLVRRGGGAILNVGSIAPLYGSGPGAGLYCSAQAPVYNPTPQLRATRPAR